MATKKPKIYTATGKAKKPVAPKKLTAEYAEAVLQRVRLPQRDNQHLQSLLDAAEAVNKSREAFYAAMLDEVARRTTKLWFGYSLVRPAKR
jgi:hypothetical protein